MMNSTIRMSKRRIGDSKSILILLCACLLWAASLTIADAFVPPSVVPHCVVKGINQGPMPSSLSVFGGDGNNDDDGANKFDMAQRIESLKSVVLGALSGGIALTPIAYLHYVALSSVPNTAQWEFTTDMSSLEAALFAIVYRYAVRANDNNPMLNQGVVGAFVVVRTLANIQVTDTCQSVPLRCGPPLGYFDWNMIQQAAWGGVESAFLFGAASLAMEFAFKQNWISKFD
eukprot:CAMPEP_0116135934 /NCGR_PEP_ID=MMETSP0329-20121206/11455_1 /TAXON_ID=697910 /ORGANISM="Pseudo-nitzschia arenysensis, Strain B593" /LENGTH=229 /DNA_ID=CAMNT_0003630767 /DNA_START=153 /DNA_END=842 /DNA_ORIENTATION=+